MAAFPRTVDVSLAVLNPPTYLRIDELFADEPLIPGPAYIHTNGRVRQSIGTAANAAAKVDGWVIKAQPNTGFPTSLYKFPQLSWGPTTATPGTTYLYLSTVKGELETTATAGGTSPIAKVVAVYPNEDSPSAVIDCWQNP